MYSRDLIGLTDLATMGYQPLCHEREITAIKSLF